MNADFKLGRSAIGEMFNYELADSLVMHKHTKGAQEGMKWARKRGREGKDYYFVL